MGCHFLLQCIKVKSESEVAQSCPTLCDPMDCSLPGSSVHGIFQARVLEWGDSAFSASHLYVNLKMTGEWCLQITLFCDIGTIKIAHPNCKYTSPLNQVEKSVGDGGKMFLRNSFQQEILSHMILDRIVFKSVFWFDTVQKKFGVSN